MAPFLGAILHVYVLIFYTVLAVGAYTDIEDILSALNRHDAADYSDYSSASAYDDRDIYITDETAASDGKHIKQSLASSYLKLGSDKGKHGSRRRSRRHTRGHVRQRLPRGRRRRRQRKWWNFKKESPFKDPVVRHYSRAMRKNRKREIRHTMRVAFKHRYKKFHDRYKQWYKKYNRWYRTHSSSTSTSVTKSKTNKRVIDQYHVGDGNHGFDHINGGNGGQVGYPSPQQIGVLVGESLRNAIRSMKKDSYGMNLRLPESMLVINKNRKTAKH
mmetsp:Transcript_5708/g.9215  ORF Transcript_5708/g.9215 Transcript_5708/m.9215 type:complete len:273 (+) Transcript_5708:43-861(+)